MDYIEISLFTSFGLFVYLFYRFVWRKALAFLEGYRNNIKEDFDALSSKHNDVTLGLEEIKKRLDHAQQECRNMIDKAHMSAEANLLRLKEEQAKYIKERQMANQHIIERIHTSHRKQFLQLIINHVMNQAKGKLSTNSVEFARINDFDRFMKNEYKKNSQPS